MGQVKAEPAENVQKNMEDVMSPANVKIDPAAGDAAAVKCEPAGESDGASSTSDSCPDAISDGDERVPEEAGYGYGV